jgi:DNA-binding protein YbaB
MNPFKLKEMMQAAKTMSSNMQGIQSKLSETLVQGSSPGEEVTITAKCTHEPTAVQLSSSFSSLPKSQQEELILAALNACKQKIDGQSQAEIMSLAKNIDPTQLQQED